MIYTPEMIEFMREQGDEEALKMVSAMEEINARGYTYEDNGDEIEAVLRKHLGDEYVDRELMPFLI